VEECRVGNGSRIGAANNSFALRAQGRHRERHRDAMITVGAYSTKKLITKTKIKMSVVQDWNVA
jgi:hypothetical protein